MEDSKNAQIVIEANEINGNLSVDALTAIVESLHIISNIVGEGITVKVKGDENGEIQTEIIIENNNIVNDSYPEPQQNAGNANNGIEIINEFGDEIKEFKNELINEPSCFKDNLYNKLLNFVRSYGASYYENPNHGIGGKKSNIIFPELELKLPPLLEIIKDIINKKRIMESESNSYSSSGNHGSNPDDDYSPAVSSNYNNIFSQSLTISINNDSENQVDDIYIIPENNNGCSYSNSYFKDKKTILKGCATGCDPPDEGIKTFRTTTPSSFGPILKTISVPLNKKIQINPEYRYVIEDGYVTYQAQAPPGNNPVNSDCPAHDIHSFSSNIKSIGHNERLITINIDEEDYRAYQPVILTIIEKDNNMPITGQDMEIRSSNGIDIDYGYLFKDMPIDGKYLLYEKGYELKQEVENV